MSFTRMKPSLAAILSDNVGEKGSFASCSLVHDVLEAVDVDLAAKGFGCENEHVFVAPRPAVEEEDGGGGIQAHECDRVEACLLLGGYLLVTEEELGVEVNVAKAKLRPFLGGSCCYEHGAVRFEVV